MGGNDHSEFPLLSALGLYAASILGDGNCLFNALSDQLYGHQNEHAAIRSRVIEHMRENADYYKQFIDVHPGGGTRRNPKRKNAGSYSTPTNFVPPSAADINRVFESHLQCMARGGTYGDNMEITAFASAFGYDVKIYQRDFAYMVSSNGDDSTSRPVAHIAYHNWEHYSSIRNLDGPHTGMPEVSPKLLSPEEELRQKEKLAEAPQVLPWQIDVVLKSLPFLADKPTIKRALQAARGDINAAVSNLMEAEDNGSTSSQVESSSVERDHDSEDDTHEGANKKQDRRMSRVSRAHRSRDSKHALSKLATHDGSEESFSSWESEASSQPESSQQSQTGHFSFNDDGAPFIKTELSRSTPNSSDSQPYAPVAKGPMRIKLLPPKPPAISDASQRVGKTSQTGLRLTARDRKDIKKQAQKAARKERHQADAKNIAPTSTAPLASAPASVGISLRANGLTETPPVETLRTLWI